MYRIGRKLDEWWDKLWKPKSLVTPFAATSEEWDAWTNNYRSKHPFRFFMTEKVPLEIRVFYRRFISEPIWWIKYRTTHRYNFIRTGLKPGWYEYDELIEKSLIFALKDHIETEMSTFYNEYDDIPEDKRYEFIIQKREKFIAELKEDESHQAISEQEQLDIYKWIKTDYETWKDAHDEVGLDAFYDKMKTLGLNRKGSLLFSYPEPYDSELHELFKKVWELEDRRRQEVDAMLLRIVKVRHSLWI
jgi:hypothetical protein